MEHSNRTGCPIQEHEIGHFVDRVKELIGKGSVRSFAQKGGVAPGTLHNILDGGYPRLDILIAIANAGDVTVEWLATGRGNKYYTQDMFASSGSPVLNTSKIQTDDFALINMYDAEVSMGSGAWCDQDNIITQLAFRRDWLIDEGLKAEKCALIMARGDSMESTIDDGSTILINLEDNVLSRDGVYVIRFDGHLLAKRLQRSFDGSVFIKSDNDRYEKIHVPPDQVNNIDIIGRVAWYASVI